MACMSLTNFIATYAWLLIGVIFLTTALVIAQVRVNEEIETANGTTIPGFSEGAVNAYIAMNFIFAGLSFGAILFIVIFTYLFKSGIPSFISGFLSFPPTTISAIISGTLLLFLTALFIGNTIFLGKIRRVLEDDPNALPTSPGVAKAFWIINIVFSVITPLAAFGLYFLAYSGAGFAAKLKQTGLADVVGSETAKKATSTTGYASLDAILQS